MIDEIAKPVAQGIKDRIRNPIVVSFVISWCLRNWKIFVILLGGDSVDEKFAMISKLDTGIRAMFVTPLAYATAYVLIMPLILWRIHRYQLKFKAISEEESIKSQTRLRGIQEKADRGSVEVDYEDFTSLGELENIVFSHKKVLCDLKLRHENEADKLSNLHATEVGVLTAQIENLQRITRMR